MDTIILTNNPDLEGLAPQNMRSFLINGEASTVLTAARDRIHLGAKLLAHPMAGRLRPNETPYMTVFLAEKGSRPAAEQAPGDAWPMAEISHEVSLELPSLEIIEYCLAEERKYASMPKKYDDALLSDLRFISCELAKVVLEEL